MMDFEVVDVFECKDRVCVIIKAAGYDGPWHNGYVQVAPHNVNKSYDDFTDDIINQAFGGKDIVPERYCLCEQLTFSDVLDAYKHPEIPEGTYFFGFDSAHAWDTEGTRSFDFMKERTIRLAYEMAMKGI